MIIGNVESHGRGAGKGDCLPHNIFVISQRHCFSKVELEEENVGDSKLLDVNVNASSFSSQFWIALTLELKPAFFASEVSFSCGISS